LGLPGFEFDTSEQVRDTCLNGRNVSALLSQATTLAPATVTASPQGSLQRVSDVPIYFADSLVRRAVPLQQTSDARAPQARMNGPTMAAQGLQAGDRVRLETLTGHAELETALDHGVPDACVRVAAAHSSTAALGPMFGELRLTKIAVQRAA
jgi:NADH-quinone oxidoreductase subunit G